ncbi:ribosomal protein S5-alanine N-acetyltransferase [Undibacterium sp.]|jgi:ribosomal-protein-alanine N-acetyltransferase|uniref:ribosomal protein S5-alanine N-acetyltransferase n=1 Tax=Undibacterium sp. TaxID=1914977 RepID=UPI00272FF05B|nr:ribosomal protein S5-alanine N-acetyltransferase [Undibacterium sp.]MDP1976566.1 ribosomal protein S5-alanine N-acetyltransferase [Undibacterium sp.]
MSKVVIATARLQLRVLMPEHAPMMQQYLLLNRSHLAPWEPVRDEDFFSLEKCEERLLSSSRLIEAGLALHFAVCMDEKMIGICNFSNIVRGVFHACHLGYAIAEKQQGQGYMQEAVRAGIAHMFQQQGLHRVMANYVPENLRSAALLERLGFEKEGYAKSYLKINGIWRDHILTALVNQNN